MIQKVNINKVKLNPNNPRIIKNDKFNKLVKSIKDFPEMLDIRPIVVDNDMMVLGGNMRLKACKEAGLTEVAIIKADQLTQDQQKEFIIKDNISYGEWEYEQLLDEYKPEQIIDWGQDLPTPKHQFEEEIKTRLADRFIVPPFSILDGRQGDWQKRANDWKALIQEIGESRENTLAKIDTLATTKTIYLNMKLGVSLLSPVLCEIACHWFAPDKSNIIDPFAGDTVFGYVATFLGHNFKGIEIRPEQVELNNLKNIKNATFICDDGQNVDKYIEPESQDLIFSCPPYYNLEEYSDLANDASNQETYEDFIKILDNAFTKAIAGLKQNRFAVIVVGDLRDKKGYYYNFHEDVKFIFQKNGMPLYNELILIEPVGIQALRVNKSMNNRKTPKTHQNVLIFHKPETGELPPIESVYRKVFVFHKGDPKEIQNNFKKITYNNIELGLDVDDELKTFIDE